MAKSSVYTVIARAQAIWNIYNKDITFRGLSRCSDILNLSGGVGKWEPNELAETTEANFAE